MNIPVLVDMLTLAVKQNDDNMVKVIQEEIKNTPVKDTTVVVNLFTVKRKNKIKVIGELHKASGFGLKNVANWVEPTVTTKIEMSTGKEIEVDTEVVAFEFDMFEGDIYRLFTRLKNLQTEFTFEFGSATLSNFIK